MKVYQRAKIVLANEGVSGLLRRIFGRLRNATRNGSNAPSAAFLEEHSRLIEDFHARALSLGYGDLRKYLWYHTIDLGDGLITPGIYDYRQSLPDFKFPADMKGMDVLDVGSATGFFAFEFERRGATVTSVELPSTSVFDRFPGETLQQTLDKYEEMYKREEEALPGMLRHGSLIQESTTEELYHYQVDGPFMFCHKVLNSKVRRHYSTIYDLSQESLKTEGYDLVFLGDVLVHTIYPLKALAAAAAVCRGTMIIAQQLPGLSDSEAAMIYIGGDKIGEDTASWWLPNRPCMEQMLRKLGFKQVEVVGSHSGHMRPLGATFQRTIIHATR